MNFHPGSAAGLLFICFLILTNALTADDNTFQPKVLDPAVLEVDPRWGKVMARHPGSSEKVVVHLLDFHAHPEAQDKMMDLIRFFNREHGIRLVLVEGATGNADVTALRGIAGRRARTKVARRYLNKGLITGEEFLQLTEAPRLVIRGIEDGRLYAAHLQSYLRLMDDRPAMLSFLSELNRIVELLKDKVYSPALKDLELASARYESRRMSLQEYTIYLETLARQHDIPLKRFSVLSEILRLDRRQPDEEAVHREYVAFMESAQAEIRRRLLPDEIKNRLLYQLIMTMTKNLKTSLPVLRQELKLSLKRYPALKRFLQSLEKIRDIDDRTLHREIEGLREAVTASISAGEDEKRLVLLSSHVRQAILLVNLDLMPEDLERWRERAGDFQPLQWMVQMRDIARRHRLNADLVPADTPVTYGMLLHMDAFYRAAHARDRVLAERVTAGMNAAGEASAIVITGGFHSGPLLNALKRRGIAFVSVRPVLAGAQPGAEPLYDEVILWKLGISRNRSGIPNVQAPGWLRPPAAAESLSPSAPTQMDAMRMEMIAENDARSSAALLEEVRQVNRRIHDFMEKAGSYQKMVGETRADIATIEKMTRPDEIREAAARLRRKSLLFDIYRLIQRIKQVYGDALIDSQRVMSIVYSPCVGYVSKLIKFDPSYYEEFVMHDPSAPQSEKDVWLVSNGTALLGYGNMGVKPMGAVLEGKQSLLRHFGGVDSNLLLVDCSDLMERYESERNPAARQAIARELIDRMKDRMRRIKRDRPNAIFMMEDIAAPFCFDLERELNEEGIPTIHDDQHGTAIVTAAAAVNALRIAGYDVDGSGEPDRKKLQDAKLVCYGAGASAFAVTRLIKHIGVGSIIVFDSKGPLYPGRSDAASFSREKALMALYHSIGDWPREEEHALKEALKDADGFLGLSAMPSTERTKFHGREREFLQDMASKAFVFAMANPIPEFQDDVLVEDPVLKEKIFAVGTGRFGGKGQSINNSSAFPGLYHALAFLARTGRLGSEFDLLRLTRLAAFGLADAVSAAERERNIVVPPTFDGETYNSHVTQTIAHTVFEGVLGEVPHEVRGQAIQEHLRRDSAALRARMPEEIRDFFDLLEFDARRISPGIRRRLSAFGVGTAAQRLERLVRQFAEQSAEGLEIISLRDNESAPSSVVFVSRRILEAASFLRGLGEETWAQAIEQIPFRAVLVRDETMANPSGALSYLADDENHWQAGLIGPLEGRTGSAIYAPFSLMYHAAVKADETGDIEPFALMLRHMVENVLRFDPMQELVRPRFNNEAAYQAEAAMIRHRLRDAYGLDLAAQPALEGLLGEITNREREKRKQDEAA